jgi:5-methylcytosine-specific restriction endonuclease McrA
MKSIGQRKSRLRLNPESYRKLRNDVLERDGWRCQNCGTSERLQVHHIRSRSALGDDAAANLITLCGDCHRLVHEPEKKRFRVCLETSNRVSGTQLSRT